MHCFNDEAISDELEGGCKQPCWGADVIICSSTFFSLHNYAIVSVYLSVFPHQYYSGLIFQLQ